MRFRVSFNDRSRVITLFIKHKLHFKKGRFDILKEISAKENIFASVKTFRRI